MGSSPILPVPPNPEPPAQPPSNARPWSADEKVVAAFAVLGVFGAVFFPMWFTVPPVITSFLMATGLAALAYRFLGGVGGASFAVGTLKLGGALAALVGIAMLINQTLEKQVAPLQAPPPPYQVWEVNAVVTDQSGKVIEPLEAGDVEIDPPAVRKGRGGRVKIDLYSQPNLNNKVEFPVIVVTHKGYGRHLVDLDPNAKNDVDIKRDGRLITISQIPLPPPDAGGYHPSDALPSPVPYTAEPAVKTGSNHQ